MAEQVTMWKSKNGQTYSSEAEAILSDRNYSYVNFLSSNLTSEAASKARSVLYDDDVAEVVLLALAARFGVSDQVNAALGEK